MNINFGLFPPLRRADRGPDGERLRGTAKTIARKRAISERALADLDRWLAGEIDAAGGRITRRRFVASAKIVSHPGDARLSLLRQAGMTQMR